jgi:hypothetical protein
VSVQNAEVEPFSMRAFVYSSVNGATERKSVPMIPAWRTELMRKL